MGTAGRDIVGKHTDQIIELLSQGIAAELNDAYRYLLLSKIASGLRAGPVADLFARTAADEWAHVALLLDRVLQMGGTPPGGPVDTAAVSRTGYHPPPGDPTDLRAMLIDSLAGERAAIRFYHELFTGTRGTDPVTAELALRALSDAISDEDDLQRLLAGWPDSLAVHGPASDDPATGNPVAGGG